MPRYNVWVRKDDQTKWEAIDNKSEWISERLNYPTMAELVANGDAEVVDVEMVDARKFTKPRAPKATDYCDHGQLKGQCLAKKCPYGRGV